MAGSKLLFGTGGCKIILQGGKDRSDQKGEWVNSRVSKNSLENDQQKVPDPWGFCCFQLEGKNREVF
jgi:hypothetical protein